MVQITYQTRMIVWGGGGVIESIYSVFIKRRKTILFQISLSYMVDIMIGIRQHLSEETLDLHSNFLAKICRIQKGDDRQRNA
jgi:hypothetical protein